eukprot:7620027-Pyramimonas_sp.AAC.1
MQSEQCQKNIRRENETLRWPKQTGHPRVPPHGAHEQSTTTKNTRVPSPARPRSYTSVQLYK